MKIRRSFLMKTLSELFEISHGNKLDLNKMKRLSPDKGGVNFVGRSSENNGISATVAPVPGLALCESGLITVALGGSYLLAAFVQLAPFYTAQNVAVLRPRGTLSMGQKVYICMCIRHNRARYSAFGREANRTLRDLLIPAPEEFPSWLSDAAVEGVEGRVAPKITRPTPELDVSSWKSFTLFELFDIKKGKRLTKAQMRPGETPFVSAIEGDNGVVTRIDRSPNHEANTISIAYDGSVGETFYQPEKFWASDHINVLYPKFEMTPAIGLFLSVLIRREKYRFNFGRAWHMERMKASTIRLPTMPSGIPDWEFMARYMRSLPWGERVA